MGRIKRFNLKKIMAQSRADYFFETGTWKGDGLAYASKFSFKKLYSSEIIKSVAEKAIARFEQDKRIKIIIDSSTNALTTTLKNINGNCIFWLDAHFPGAEEGLKDYNEEDEESIKLPLQKELEIISTRKEQYKDVILIDDLRIYEEGAFESGNLPDNVLPPKVRNTHFAQELFGTTHDIIKFYEDEGYLVLIPNNLQNLSQVNSLLFTLYNSIFKKLV